MTISRNQHPRETERHTVDSGVEVSGGSGDNSTDENINSSDEIPMSELSSVSKKKQITPILVISLREKMCL